MVAKHLESASLRFSLWIALVTIGTGALWAYEKRPGPSHDVMTHWQSNALVPQNLQGPTVVVFLHPMCPCSRATLAELGHLAKAGPAEFHTVFFLPDEKAEDWKRADNVKMAREMPRVQIHFDVQGNVIEEFGAATSGHCMCFRSDGSLAFSGGITASRGHEGPSRGRFALEQSLVQSKGNQILKYPVYGCSIKGG